MGCAHAKPEVPGPSRAVEAPVVTLVGDAWEDAAQAAKLEAAVRSGVSSGGGDGVRRRGVKVNGVEAPTLQTAAAAALTSFPLQKAGSGSEDWVNLSLAKAWPSIKAAIERMVLEELEPEMKDGLPVGIGHHIEIQEFLLGDEPPKMSGFAAVDSDDGVSVRMHMDLNSAVTVNVSIGPVKLGVQNVAVSGPLVVEMTPLISELPVFSAIHVFFVDPPELSYDFTGLAQIVNLGVIKRAVRRAVDGILASHVVMPNAVVIQLADSEDSLTRSKLGYLRPPLGILRVHPISGSRLADSDWSFHRKTCDPYLRLKLGSQTKESSFVKETLDPVWPAGESHDLVVFSAEQLLRVELYDEDFSKDDDYLGCIHPLKAKAAVESSGKDLKLFQKAKRIQSGATVTSGAGQGSLKIQSVWLQPSADRSAVSSGVLLVASVGMLEMPEGVTKAVQLRLKVGELSVTSPFRYTVSGLTAERAKTASQELKDVMLRAKKMGFSTDTIAALTGSPASVVDEVVAQSKESASCGWLGACCMAAAASREVTFVEPSAIEPQELADGKSVRISIESLMPIVLPAGVLEGGGDMTLELLDRSKVVISLATFPLGEVPFQWPIPPGDRQKQRELAGTCSARVSVGFSVSGLVAGTPPEA